MSKQKTTSNSGKHKQEKGSAPNRHSRLTAGGELHQIAGGEHPALTTNQGVALADNQNSLRANPHGPTLLEDFIFREKITHFDHERIPERIVHARATGVHGFFELTTSLKRYTTARILTEVGAKTPVFTRISTVAGGAGSVDTPRDVRGFAVKFYTKEGNWDLVGNNIPVFFIQDAIKFPDLIHAVKMEPDRGFPQSATAHDTFWDFISLTPESMHMVMWIMSDRTIIDKNLLLRGLRIKIKDLCVKKIFRGDDTTDWREIPVDYGRYRLDVRVPPNCVIIGMKEIPLIADPRAAYEEALSHPIGCPPLAEIIRNKNKPAAELTAAVTVSDIIYRT